VDGHNRTISTAASHSEGPGFDSRSRDWDFSWAYSVPPDQWRDSTLNQSSITYLYILSIYHS